MELSERCIQTLENEGFTSVYEASLTPGQVFSLPQNGSQVTIFVTEGTLGLEMNSEVTELLPGNRFDVSAQRRPTVSAGAGGCQLVLGEKE